MLINEAEYLCDLILMAQFVIDSVLLFSHLLYCYLIVANILLPYSSFQSQLKRFPLHLMNVHDWNASS